MNTTDRKGVNIDGTWTKATSRGYVVHAIAWAIFALSALAIVAAFTIAIVADVLGS